jgi:hypothetical protein
MGAVEAAASEPAPGRVADWRAGVGEALTRLRTAFDAHVQVTEAPDGLFAQVVEEEPRLVKRVERLRGEHETITATLATAERQVAGERDPDDVREAVLELLGALARHRHRGADLLHEAFVVDVSVGD